MRNRTTIHVDENGSYIEPTQDERMFAMLIYITSFITAIVAPLIIWLIKRDDSRYIDFHGKQYLNFCISYFIYSVIGTILIPVLIGGFILAVIGVAGIIFIIVAGVKAFQGEYYRIPFIFNIISLSNRER